MDGIYLIQDLAVVLLAAGLAGAVCKRFGLSVIVGYLMAGVLIGPHTPPFSYVTDVARIQTLSQIGLVFLMFGIGLGLSLTRLRRMGLTPLLTTALGAILMLQLARGLGWAIGWEGDAPLFLAGMLMVSSSAVIAKLVDELKLGHERAGQLALSVTVLEDVVAVVMLAVLGAQSAVGGVAEDAPHLSTLLGTLLAFVVLLVGAGLCLVPKLLRPLGGQKDPELITIVVAGLLLLMAWAADKAGYSLALGAFLLGTMVAEMPQKALVEKAFGGMRNMFSSVFFVAIGMMIEVELMVKVWPWILVVGTFTLVARTFALGAALTALGQPPEAARRAGLLLTPVGEFSFVIAQMGVTAGILAPSAYPLAVGVSIFTVLVAPALNRNGDRVVAWTQRVEPGWLRRFLETYERWIARLAELDLGGLWWKVSRKRVLQIASEVLIVTGLMTFAQPLWLSLLDSVLAERVAPWILSTVFWSALVLLVLIPLVAIWRNLEALGLITADFLGKRVRLPRGGIELLWKMLTVLALALWLTELLPRELLPLWAWAVVVAGIIIAAVVMFRRLIRWHSQWQFSVEGTLSGAIVAGEGDAGISPRWWEDGGNWNLVLQECVLPEMAHSAGRRIGDLNIRKRFGCAIAEINRQGVVINLPGPQDTLYPGDRLLLVGAAPTIPPAREELERVRDAGDNLFDDVRLQVVTLPPTDTPTAATLGALKTGPEAEVIVLGLERDGRRILNPTGNEALRSGDQLLVLATPERARRFCRAWAGEPKGGAAGPPGGA